MEVQTATFVGSFTSSKQLPNEGMPEIAFVGRSNVGKSSLINRLLGVKRLALISSTPGKTRKINLFVINKRLLFVDLPGYGYAKVSKRERAGWQQMIEGYLLGSKQLKLLVQLIDSRHGMMTNDHQMTEWLQFQKLPYLPVLTKADKLKKNDLARLRRAVKDPRNEFYGAVPCSAQTALGIKDIWNAIDSVL